MLTVEGVAETFVCFVALLVDFFLNLGNVVFDENVSPVTLFGVFVVNQGVVEGVDVAGCLPDAGVHKDGGVDADDVLMVLHHGTPPILLDVVF